MALTRKEIGKRYRNAHPNEAAIRAKKWRDKTDPDKRAEYRRQYYRDSKAKDPLYVRRKNLWQSYRITLEEYDKLLLAQGGVCAICGTDKGGWHAKDGVFHVDHCHNSDKIRGLLCGDCNVGLGKFKDSPVALRNAAAYLTK